MKRVRKIIITIILISCIILIGGYFIVPPVWQLRQKQISIKIWHKNRKEPTLMLVGPATSSWVRINNVSKHLLHALIVAEDSRFYEHCGIDITEILNSFKLNIKKKQYVRGASTITQQVVRAAFLYSKKTLWRKFREVLGALLLEQILPKDHILEWYINIVKFGDNIYGVKKASWFYFKTQPEFLTIEQSIYLVLILPSPSRWSISLKQKKLTDFAQKRFTVIAYNMKLRGYITEEQFLQVLATGNFGQPVKEYEKFYKIYAADKNYTTAISDIESNIETIDNQDTGTMESEENILNLEKQKNKLQEEIVNSTE